MNTINLFLLKAQRALYKTIARKDLSLQKRMNIKVMASAVKGQYRVDLSSPQHTHSAVQIKQNFVFWLSESGMFSGSSDIQRHLQASGLSVNGLSRRNICHLVNTMGNQERDASSYSSFKPFMDSQV
tara:strand:- start:3958 stop:4338 length:381 start_codon:yes stop_codon:yes gene_type:complete